MSKIVHFGLAVFLCNLSLILAEFEKSITFQVQAGKIDCLYHKVMAQHVIDLEYQVIDTTQGELDISFQLADPLGQILVGEYKKMEGRHQYTAKMDGDYRFCFDNTFSTFSMKTVFFDLMVDDGESDEYDDEGKEMDFGYPGESYTMKVHDISESVNKVRDSINAARRLQEALSAHEARDRNLAEEMCHKVFLWSVVQVVLLCLVGWLQVFFVKSLFEDSRKISWQSYFNYSTLK